MKIKASVRVMNEARQGTSSATGTMWRRQELVLGWSELGDDGRSHEQFLLVSVMGDDIERLAAQGVTVGCLVEGDVSFRTSTFNNRVHNEVRFSVNS